MILTKYLSQILVSLMIIVNLTMSLDFGVFNQTQRSIHQTELTTTTKNSDYRIVRYKSARNQIVHQESSKLDANEAIWITRLISSERSTSTCFKNQRNSLLAYKFSLQNRLLNVIIQQRSYRS